MTQETEMSDRSENPVVWAQGLVARQHLQTSFELHSTLGLTELRHPKEEDQIATALQMCKLTLQELYNNEACDISLKYICKDKVDL